MLSKLSKTPIPLLKKVTVYSKFSFVNLSYWIITHTSGNRQPTGNILKNATNQQLKLALTSICIYLHTMGFNGNQELTGCQHSSKYFLLGLEKLVGE